MGGLSLTRIPVLPGKNDRKTMEKRSYSRNLVIYELSYTTKASASLRIGYNGNSDLAKYTSTLRYYQICERATKTIGRDQENVVLSGFLALPFFLTQILEVSTANVD